MPTVRIESKTVFVHICMASGFCHSGEAANSSKFRPKKGFTIRDVQMATQIEDHFRNHFQANNLGVTGECKQHGWGRAYPRSLADIEAILQPKNSQTPSRDGITKQLDCFICRRAQHEPAYCPERYTKMPPKGKPCAHCGLGHWSMNCSHRYTRSRERARSASQDAPRTLRSQSQHEGNHREDEGGAAIREIIPPLLSHRNE